MISETIEKLLLGKRPIPIHASERRTHDFSGADYLFVSSRVSKSMPSCKLLERRIVSAYHDPILLESHAVRQQLDPTSLGANGFDWESGGGGFLDSNSVKRVSFVTACLRILVSCMNAFWIWLGLSNHLIQFVVTRLFQSLLVIVVAVLSSVVMNHLVVGLVCVGTLLGFFTLRVYLCRRSAIMNETSRQRRVRPLADIEAAAFARVGRTIGPRGKLLVLDGSSDNSNSISSLDSVGESDSATSISYVSGAAPWLTSSGDGEDDVSFTSTEFELRQARVLEGFVSTKKSTGPFKNANLSSLRFQPEERGDDDEEEEEHEEDEDGLFEISDSEDGDDGGLNISRGGGSDDDLSISSIASAASGGNISASPTIAAPLFRRVSKTAAPVRLDSASKAAAVDRAREGELVVEELGWGYSIGAEWVLGVGMISATKEVTVDGQSQLIEPTKVMQPGLSHELVLSSDDDDYDHHDNGVDGGMNETHDVTKEVLPPQVGMWKEVSHTSEGSGDGGKGIKRAHSHVASGNNNAPRFAHAASAADSRNPTADTNPSIRYIPGGIQQDLENRDTAALSNHQELGAQCRELVLSSDEEDLIDDDDGLDLRLLCASFSSSLPHRLIKHAIAIPSDASRESRKPQALAAKTRGNRSKMDATDSFVLPILNFPHVGHARRARRVSGVKPPQKRDGVSTGAEFSSLDSGNNDGSLITSEKPVTPINGSIVVMSMLSDTHSREQDGAYAPVGPISTRILRRPMLNKVIDDNSAITSTHAGAKSREDSQHKRNGKVTVASRGTNDGSAVADIAGIPDIVSDGHVVDHSQELLVLSSDEDSGEGFL